MASALVACCLLVLALATGTPTPTPAPKVSPTPVPQASSTAAPKATVVRKPTAAPTPVATATPRPAATPIPTATATPDASGPNATTIGRSAEGRAMTTYALGRGARKVAIVGGIHGAPEANSAALVWELLSYYQQQPEQIPPDLELVFLPEANPDGLADGTRELADGIDANRNWPTEDWTPTSYGPGWSFLPGGGGDEPLSEPETIAMADWIDREQPVAVLSYHSAGGIVMGGPNSLREGLVQAYVNQTRPYVYLEWSLYPVTGDFAQWCEEQGIPVVEVELIDHQDADFERNLAGVQAVLDTIESIVSGNPSY